MAHPALPRQQQGARVNSSARNLCGMVSVLALALAGCGSGDESGTAGLNGTPTEKATTPTTSGVTNAQPVFRYAKISNGAYFYTGSIEEKNLILRSYPDFRCEGVAFYRTADDSGTPVYRFANLKNGGYFYTASTAERDVVIQTRPDLRLEGSTFSVSGPRAGAQAVYRLANLQNGAYLYTANPQEQQYAVNLGNWRYEGESFYGTPPPTSLAVPAGGWCPPSDPNPYPAGNFIAGDWAVYNYSITPTLPFGTPATEEIITREYLVVNSDGSRTRRDNTSAFTLFSSRAYTSAGLVSFSSGTKLCKYAPAYRTSPPSRSVVGETFNSSSTESCATQPNGTPAVASLLVKGENELVEIRTIPLGTFNTFKYTVSITSISSSTTTKTLESCWLDLITGRVVECVSTYSTIPIGQTAPTSSGTTRFRLQGYIYQGQDPIGSAVRRFSGYWNVNFSGDSVGDCSNLRVDINGQISGSCRLATPTGGYTSFSVSGSVSANGNASVAATTGAKLTGTFNSPSAGEGTWSNGSARGAWNANHI